MLEPFKHKKYPVIKRFQGSLIVISAMCFGYFFQHLQTNDVIQNENRTMRFEQN